jgi:hypothetical protein
VIGRPIISDAVYPNMRSAPEFHEMTVPSTVFEIIASSLCSMMAEESEAGIKCSGPDFGASALKGC